MWSRPVVVEVCMGKPTKMESAILRTERFYGAVFEYKPSAAILRDTVTAQAALIAKAIR